MKYIVDFRQIYSYMVEAEDEDEAFEKAEALFDKEMDKSYKYKSWDEVEVNEVN